MAAPPSAIGGNVCTNLAELEANGPAGHLEALSLCLYDPQAHQSGLNSANGTLFGPRLKQEKAPFDPLLSWAPALRKAHARPEMRIVKRSLTLSIEKYP